MRQAPPELLHRFAAVETTPAEMERAGGKRKIRVCFSSETPVMRREADGPYYEVLSHDPAHADISLLQDGGAFLDEHDFKRQIGSVERAWLDQDRKGRADLSFASTELGKERLKLMAENHRRDISVGYAHTKLISETSGKDGLPVRTFAWAAYEISSVAIGADHWECGVGRSHNSPPHHKIIMSETQNKDHEIHALADAFVKDFPHIQNEIRAAKVRCLAEGKEHREFSREMFALLQKKPQPQTTMIRALDHEIGMSSDEIKKYSIHNGLRSMIKNGKPEGYELEVHQQLERTSGMRFDGMGIPQDVILGMSRRDFLQRDMQATIFGSGGAAVPTQVMTPMIDLLRNRTVCARLGATVLAGLQGNLAFPRIVSPNTAQSVSEIGTLNDSQLGLDQVVMTPKRVGATTTISKQLILQSSPDIEAVLRNDLMTVVAIKHDALLLNGQGSNSEPLGILNTPGVASVTFGGAASWSKVVDMETLIASANADGGRMAYATTPSVRGAWKKLAVALTGATTVSSAKLWEAGNFNDGSNDGMVNDYRAASSNQIPNNLVICADWTSLIAGFWGGLDLVVDVFTKAKQAEVVTTVNTWLDGALRHPQSFVVSADAGNQ